MSYKEPENWNQPPDPCEPKLCGLCEEDSIFNCQECLDSGCEHWAEYNECLED